MKKFLVSFFVFLICSLLIVYIDCKIYPTAQEVYDSIGKSKMKKAVKILIIGDSGGDQLYDFNSYNDDVYSLTCNQAITLAGQFFLLSNFINANKDSLPQKVILLYHPLSFGNNLDKYCYNFFLKPFYNSEYKHLMNDNLKKRITEIPQYKFASLPIINISNYTPNLRNIKLDEDRWFSEISEDYFVYISNLCRDNNIDFEIYPGLCSESKKNNIMHFINLNNNSSLEKYISNITFLNDSLFVYDGIHLKSDHVPIDYLHLLKKN
jgi:hypothetical protein